MPTQPNHLNYANAQILLIGEGEHGADKATEPQPEDEKEGKEKPLEEMEKLEGEDQIRVKHLKGRQTFFSQYKHCSVVRTFSWQPKQKGTLHLISMTKILNPLAFTNIGLVSK